MIVPGHLQYSYIIVFAPGEIEIETAIPHEVLIRAAEEYEDEPESGCRITTIRTTSGKGRMIIRFKPMGDGPASISTHRAAWMYFNGEIPPDTIVYQDCGNLECVNVDHLRILDKDSYQKMIRGYGRTCSSEGCEKPCTGQAGRRGMCIPHYNEWRAENGSRCAFGNCERARVIGAYCVVHDHLFTDKECLTPGCANSPYGGNYCGPCTRLTALGRAEPCKVEWGTRRCLEPSIAQGYCNSHYRRFLDHGDPLAGGTFHGSDDITNVGAHFRVRALWGVAAQYPCIECGGQAKDWAYDGTDPTQKLGAITYGQTRRPSYVYYSIYPEFYMPMCRKCHGKRDGARMADELREYREWKVENRLTLKDVILVRDGDLPILRVKQDSA